MFAARTEDRIGVSMFPGAMQLTRMAYSPRSIAAHFENMITDAFEVWYVHSLGAGTPPIDGR
jgi:hypothetical protein